MSWNDILQLQQDGQDIESKGMTHRDLNQLAPKDLEFEVGGSKQCLENHGINFPNIFAVDRFLSTRNGLKADNIHAGAEPATNPANKA